MAASTTAIAAANTSVSRRRIGTRASASTRRSTPAVVGEPVADATDGLERPCTKWAVDLSTQPADVDVDDVRTVLVAEIPRRVEQLQPGQDAPGPAQEGLEQCELRPRQHELDVPAPDAPSGGVESQRSDLDDRRTLRLPAPRQRTDAGEELGERERLRQVVVGAAVQPGHAIVDAVPRGQHQDRRPDAAASELAADVDPVPAGEHDVEDDRVVRSRTRHPERVLAGLGDVGRVALLDEPAAEE